MKTSTFLLLLPLAGSLTLTACKNKDEPETTAPSDPAPVSGDDENHPDKDPNKGKIRIGPKIQELCNIDAEQANFDFDSAALSAGAKATLDALAECFTTGPAKDYGMNLVGHADPRGSEDYNFALGQRRAGSVASYLAGKGLGDDRVESSSRGELDAKGTDDASWADDRRVDILLAE